MKPVFHFIPAGGGTKAFFNNFFQFFFIRNTLDTRPIGNVFKDTLRERRRLLEYHAYAVPQGQGIDFLENILAFKEDLARNAASFYPVVHAVQRLEKCRFAAAGGPDKRCDFILIYFHRNIF